MDPLLQFITDFGKTELVRNENFCIGSSGVVFIHKNYVLKLVVIRIPRTDDSFLTTRNPLSPVQADILPTHNFALSHSDNGQLMRDISLSLVAMTLESLNNELSNQQTAYVSSLTPKLYAAQPLLNSSYRDQEQLNDPSCFMNTFIRKFINKYQKSIGFEYTYYCVGILMENMTETHELIEPVPSLANDVISSYIWLAHSSNIVHCDLNFFNILFRKKTADPSLPPILFIDFGRCFNNSDNKVVINLDDMIGTYHQLCTTCSEKVKVVISQDSFDGCDFKPTDEKDIRAKYDILAAKGKREPQAIFQIEHPYYPLLYK